MTELICAGFETMVEGGIAPEIAYFECVTEAKLILDMIVEEGFTAMFEGISNTAEYGAQVSGKRIISDSVRTEMDKLLQEIKAGKFAKAWNAEVAEACPNLHDQRKKWSNSNIDVTASKMRNSLC
jgi:ketol-acid reductoisomerase